MDGIRFDSLTRIITRSSSRRQTLLALLLGGAVVPLAGDEISAGPGCKDVGKRCQDAEECCSNICKKRRKNGKKRCRPHDTGGCKPGHSNGECGGSENVDCTPKTGGSGVCDTTTGNAGYCTRSAFCFACTKDEQCQQFETCGPRAACITCALCPNGTACASPNEDCRADMNP